MPERHSSIALSDPLRVMLVTDAVGGVWDSCLALATALCRSGEAQVLLVVVGPPPSESKAAVAQRVPGLELRHLDGRLEWMEGGRDWLALHRAAAARLAMDWDADLVHVNQLGLAGLSQDLPGSSSTSLPSSATSAGYRPPRRPPVLLGIHSDVVTWWSWVKDGGSGSLTLPDYLRWQHDLAQQALRQADATVCPSGFLAAQLVRHYPLDVTPYVIHNAVDIPTPAWPGAAEEDPLPREDDLAVVVAGRAWDEAKNVRLVAEALPQCRRPWRIAVAGDVSEPGHPPSAVPTTPGLTYTGFLDKVELTRLLRRASLCIAPASYDPFGLGPTEAALAGCAVLANDIPSYREVWGTTALFFERNDAISLAAALHRLFGDAETIAHYAALGRRRVTTRYTPERMAAGYLELYRHLIDLAPGEDAACDLHSSITQLARTGTTATHTSFAG